jgi:NAD(P) transhydrogenase subunit alpha
MPRYCLLTFLVVLAGLFSLSGMPRGRAQPPAGVTPEDPSPAASAAPAQTDSGDRHDAGSAACGGEVNSAKLYVFLLSAFIGLGVISRVSRLLHTPLMSLTNAISAIAVVGAIIVAGSEYPFAIQMLGVIALAASMTNIVSGFLITDRMLKMFKSPNRGER